MCRFVKGSGFALHYDAEIREEVGKGRCCDNLAPPSDNQPIPKRRSEHTWQQKLEIERLQIKTLFAQPA